MKHWLIKIRLLLKEILEKAHREAQMVLDRANQDADLKGRDLDEQFEQ